MSMEDPRTHGGRHRRGRTGSESGVVEAEPLFTFEMLYPDDEALLDLTDTGPSPQPPWLSRVEPPPLAASADPSEFGVRAGMFKSFRRWWRQESLARAAQKRAFATAEAIIRAQAVQRSTQPFEPSPAPETHAQAVRSVMALTEERFQSLGLRSDRLQDELVGIARGMDELRRLMALGGTPEAVAEAAASALGALQERFEALVSALSEELRARSEETDRRLAEQLTLQSAQLAMLLESAVERIRAAIPEGFEDVKAAIPRELAEVRAAIPREIQRIRAVIPEEMERLRAQQRRELDQIMELSQKQMELIRATSRRELEKIREAIPEGFDELRAMIPDEFGRLRGALHEVITESSGFTSADSVEGERAEPR